jgi:hypothetical protein
MSIKTGENRLGVYKYELKYNLKCSIKIREKDAHFIYAIIRGVESTCGIPASQILYYTYLPTIEEFCENFGNSIFGFGHFYHETEIFNEIARDIKKKRLPIIGKNSYSEQKKYIWGTLTVSELVGFKK